MSFIPTLTNIETFVEINPDHLVKIKAKDFPGLDITVKMVDDQVLIIASENERAFEIVTIKDWMK